MNKTGIGELINKKAAVLPVFKSVKVFAATSFEIKLNLLFVFPEIIITSRPITDVAVSDLNYGQIQFLDDLPEDVKMISSIKVIEIIDKERFIFLADVEYV